MENKTHQPEKKIGPFQDGIGVTIWKNLTDAGTVFRSITINPRRYRDGVTGDWKDAKSFRPGDVRTLIAALEQAAAFMQAYPLPQPASEGEQATSCTEGKSYGRTESISNGHSEQLPPLGKSWSGERPESR